MSGRSWMHRRRNNRKRSWKSKVHPAPEPESERSPTTEHAYISVSDKTTWKLQTQTYQSDYAPFDKDAPRTKNKSVG